MVYTESIFLYIGLAILLGCLLIEVLVILIKNKTLKKKMNELDKTRNDLHNLNNSYSNSNLKKKPDFTHHTGGDYPN